MNTRPGNTTPMPHLRAWRVWLGVSMRELSERSGVAYMWLSQLERGASARPGTVAKLADALGISRAALLHIKPDEAPADVWTWALAPVKTHPKVTRRPASSPRLDVSANGAR